MRLVPSFDLPVCTNMSLYRGWHVGTEMVLGGGVAALINVTKRVKSGGYSKLCAAGELRSVQSLYPLQLANLAASGHVAVAQATVSRVVC